MQNRTVDMLVSVKTKTQGVQCATHHVFCLLQEGVGKKSVRLPSPHRSLMLSLRGRSDNPIDTSPTLSWV